MARFIAAGLLALLMAAAAMVATPPEVAPDSAADTVVAGELPAPWDDLDGSAWDGILFGGLAPMCQAEDNSWHHRGVYYADHTCVCRYSAPLSCEWK